MHVFARIASTALLTVGLSLGAMFPASAREVFVYQPCAVYQYVSNGTVIGGFSTDVGGQVVLSTHWGTHVGPNMVMQLVAIDITCYLSNNEDPT
ncbi:MAG: hypothetical protein E6Q50_03520 [Lysobacter sp.]|nr:MAG: hypothetical protein E6Q50_03520 [Lysobacter sp.]